MIAEASTHLMGSTITIKIDHPDGEQLIADCFKQLADYQERFSANNNQSELMQLNQLAGIRPMQVDEDLYDLIKLAVKYSCRGGYFNVAIGPLVKLWHIGFNDAQVPTPEQIQTTLKLIDPHQIELDDQNHAVYLKQAGMEIDLGGIAKGYFADQLAIKLKAAGVESALINLGGSSIVTIGGNANNSDDQWHVGLQDPRGKRTDYATILALKDEAMTTSGVYERQLIKSGRTYHHILDPQTGYPIETSIMSLTVLGHQAVLGEILTTMCFGLGPSQLNDWLNEFPGITILTIDQQGEIRYYK